MSRNSESAVPFALRRAFACAVLLFVFGTAARCSAFSPFSDRQAESDAASVGTIALEIERTEAGDADRSAPGVSVAAEIAADASSRARGFMHRKEIPPGTGMIFVYPRDERMSFWMKNTGVPLSIAFIDSRGVFREIFDMEPFCLEPVQSSGFRRYALEVPQGWFSENGLAPGCRFSPETLDALKNVGATD